MDLKEALKLPLTVSLVLLGMLAVNIAQTLIGIGAAHAAVTMAIAIVQAAIILWVSMEIRHHGGSVRLWSVAGFCWLMIMFALGMADYLTR
jgi:caa(3)-type oxidase subunit IV